MPDRLSASAKHLMKMILENPEGHIHRLGIKLVEFSAGRVTMALPYQQAIIGNPDTGVIHGGAITTLLDTCCGFCVGTMEENVVVCPTLDLRIDYMRPAEPLKTVFAQVEVFRSTRSVVFVRGVAYQDDKAQPVAQVVGTFARMSAKVKTQEAVE